MVNDTLTETFIRLQGRLRAIAATMLHSRDDAEDALQEAFMRMWQAGG